MGSDQDKYLISQNKPRFSNRILALNLGNSGGILGTQYLIIPTPNQTKQRQPTFKNNISESITITRQGGPKDQNENRSQIPDSLGDGQRQNSYGCHAWQFWGHDT